MPTSSWGRTKSAFTFGFMHNRSQPLPRGRGHCYLTNVVSLETMGEGEEQLCFCRAVNLKYL